MEDRKPACFSTETSVIISQPVSRFIYSFIRRENMNKTNTDNIAIIKLRWWSKRLLYRAKAWWRKLLISAFLVLFAVLVFTLCFYWGDINSHLLSLDKAILARVFVATGTIVAGVLAIVFSISLFSIQQAADRNTPTILEAFVKDNLNRLIFTVIASLSISMFLFAILPVKSNLTVLFVIAVPVFLAVTFLLLRIQYSHTARLVNPREQIKRLYRESTKLLRRIASYAEDMVSLGGIKHVPGDEEKSGKDASDNMLKAGLYLRFSHLFNPLDANLKQIFDLIQKYSHRREYEVTGFGLSAAAQIISGYLLLRKESTVTIPKKLLVYGTDSDNFLANNYERFSGIERIAIRNNDIELAKSVISSMEGIALQSTHVKPITGTFYNENPTTDLIAGYLSRNVIEALSADLFDVGIAGAVSLQRIGQTLVHHNYSGSIMSIFPNLKKIAQFGIIKKQSYLTNYALAGYAGICHEAVNKGYSDVRSLIRHSLDDVKEIALLALPVVEDSSLQGTLSVQNYLGAFFDASEQNAIVHVFQGMVRYVEDERNSEKDIKSMMHTFFEVNEELGSFYRDLGERIGQSESFLLHLIHMNISIIVRASFQLMSNSPKWQGKTEELEDMVSWYLSFYWATFDKHVEITRNYIWDFVDVLAYFGLRGVKDGWKKISFQSISSILSIAENSITKDKKGFGYTPPRIAEKAAFIGILAKKLGQHDTEKEVLDGLRKFHSQYIASLSGSPKEIIESFKDRLLRELSDLKRDYANSDAHGFESAEDLLFKEVSEEDLDKFIQEVAEFIQA
jgi:hypothetical protein